MKTKDKTKNSPAGKRLLIIFISVFLGAVLCFGAVFGTVAIVRNNLAVMRYRSIYLSEGVANYLAATYKTDFIRGLKLTVEDTPEFWSGEYKDGRTYGELLREQTEEYIKSIVAGSYLFDRYSSLTSAEKKAIKAAVSDKLEYLFDGDKKEFEKSASAMGFDYSDFLEATEMIYKCKMAKNAIFGEGGAVLSSPSYYEECNKYYQKYSHVKLLFIRTESEFVTDENGNRVTENGVDKTEMFNSSERAARLADIEAINAAIDARVNGENMQMTPTLFDGYLEKYSYDFEFDNGGYYFSPDSAYTSLYINNPEGITDYEEIGNTALNMEIGEYAKVPYKDGVCYIYKYEREDGAWARERYSEFFEDFYTLAANYLYSENLRLIAAEVDTREKYSRVDPVLLPYNTYIVAGVDN